MIRLRPQELVDHLAAAGIPREHLNVRGHTVVFPGKDGTAVALDAETARITFAVGTIETPPPRAKKR